MATPSMAGGGHRTPYMLLHNMLGPSSITLMKEGVSSRQGYDSSLKGICKNRANSVASASISSSVSG